MTDRRRRWGVFSWMLFDWANQPFHTLIVTFIFAPYFVAQVAGDPVAGQAIWGTTVAIAGGLTALLAPVLGAIADRTGARKPWVLAFSLPFIAGCAGLWLAVPGMDDPLPVLILFGLAFLGSELTLLFTNAMLPDIAPRRETGRVSGSGWALGYLGGLISLILVLALLAPAPGKETTLLGMAPIFGLEVAEGEPARATGPLAALWFIVFALPFFLLTRDTPRGVPLAQAARSGLADLRRTVTEARSHGRLFLFLVASMIYRDGLAALFAFGGIYASGVLGWGTFQLGVFGIIAAGVGALGAWAGGRGDAAFGPRPVIITANWALIAVCAVILLTTRESIAFVALPPGSTAPDLLFFCAGGILGAAAGALQAASRTMLVHEAEGRVAMAQAFGLYALSGRATAFIGPALIAIATAATGSQRLGVTPVIGLFALGLLLLLFLRARTGARIGD
ncbi:MFS transporter [Amaricoccus macauensis]|uniref:MFS transporter n=1 Tax=Amaricoccus macauensis TaxID=57001 RepID=UPI003C7A2EFF